MSILAVLRTSLRLLVQFWVRSATATPKGHVGRAFADAYVQVEADFGVSPQVLGIAHIQVHAYDFDPSHPASAFDAPQ